MKEERCRYCGKPAHGPGNPIPQTREEYERHGLIWVAPSAEWGESFTELGEPGTPSSAPLPTKAEIAAMFEMLKQDRRGR